jgi:transposase
MIEGLKRESLERLYIIEQKSTPEIAKIYGCSPRTIQDRCRKYGIKLSPRGRTNKWLNKSFLQKLYVKEGKTIREIAKILSCSHETVRNRCEQFGIPLKPPGGRELEIDESTLRRLYVEEEKSINEIAKIFDCAFSTISQKVKRFGLKRSLKEIVEILGDKRKNPRLSFEISVINNERRGITKDISLNGTFIKRNKQLPLIPVGSQISFSFFFPNKRKHIDVKGVVIHHGSNNDDGMGVWFKRIDERSKEFIREFIIDHLK